MGRKQESIDAMKQVLALTPDDAEALNYLGYTYADLGINLEEAESLIQQALALKPDDGYIADSLGWVYFKKGNYRQALKWLNKAVQLVPDDPTILEHLGDVYNMLEQTGQSSRILPPIPG
jgi:Flp pilus assembly protein TadD